MSYEESRKDGRPSQKIIQSWRLRRFDSSLEEVSEIPRAFKSLERMEVEPCWLEIGLCEVGLYRIKQVRLLNYDWIGWGSVWGIDFLEFSRLATAKIGEEDSRVEINETFITFYPNRAVKAWAMMRKFTDAYWKGSSKIRRGIEWRMSQKADLDDDGFVIIIDGHHGSRGWLRLMVEPLIEIRHTSLY